MKKEFQELGGFTIFPAIDLKDGMCVRLRQGAAGDSTVYGDDPVAMARRWRDGGGRALHVVDLNGAFEGGSVHRATIGEIAASVDIPVEVGGGLRTDDDVRATLDAGVSRVILGTRALSEPDCVARLADEFGSGRIAVGIDARGGLVQVRGWVETTSVMATDLARRVAGCGAGAIIYTDTATDGMLSGPNLVALAALADSVPGCPVVASGGISCAADIAAIVALGRANIVGAIVGKALYDGRATVAELNAAADGQPPRP